MRREMAEVSGAAGGAGGRARTTRPLSSSAAARLRRTSSATTGGGGIGWGTRMDRCDGLARRGTAAVGALRGAGEALRGEGEAGGDARPRRLKIAGSI